MRGPNISPDRWGNGIFLPLESQLDMFELATDDRWDEHSWRGTSSFGCVSHDDDIFFRKKTQ